MLISEDIRRYCSFNRIRSSDGREIVADILQKMSSTATCEEIWLTLRGEGQKVSESGVYFHLRWLLVHGFAEKSKGSGRQATFTIKMR